MGELFILEGNDRGCKINECRWKVLTKMFLSADEKHKKSGHSKLKHYNALENEQGGARDWI